MSEPTSKALANLGKQVGDDFAQPFQKYDLQRAAQGASVNLYRQDPAASSYQLSTLQSIDLGNRPAAVVNRATSLAGTVTGELTPSTFGATPTTGQVAVAPNGDIVVLGTDAITSVDVKYTPEVCDIIERTLTVVSNAATFDTTDPELANGVLLLREAEALAGTSTGKKIVLVPAASCAASRACLSVDKTKVILNATDAVTKVRVKLAVVPGSY